MEKEDSERKLTFAVEYVLVAARLWLNNITQDDSVCVKALFDWHFAAGM